MTREDIRLETDLAETLPSVKADPDQLTHVLLNLAVNARDAMAAGGTLRISSEPIDLDGAAAQLLWNAPPGRYVRLSVEDTGSGMSPAVLERVFEPFFTTKEVGAGTGLGLSTVYGVVKQSGGYITATSEPGSGSRFDVYPPPRVSRSASSSGRPSRLLPPAPPGSWWSRTKRSSAASSPTP